MNGDRGRFDEPGRPADYTLPRVRAISTRITSFEPRRRHFTSALPVVPDAVEFLVETASPIPIRARGPALYVGETVVMEVSTDDRRLYRFVALHPKELRPGARISLGWLGGREKDRVNTKFVYEPPAT